MTNLVLYDGLCGLCNSTVSWLLRIDRRRVLNYAPLQGETARQISLSLQRSETIVFIPNFHSKDQKIFVRSEAILQILGAVGGGWKIAAIFRIIPRRIRDFVYDWIARNRRRWFGKYETCPIPAPEVRNRFLL